MVKKWGAVLVSALVTVCFITTSVSFAGVTELTKEANKIIRNAERNMHNGKNTKADELLNEAAALIEQAKEEEPGNKTVSSTEKKWSNLRKKIDKKLGKAPKKTSSGIHGLTKKPSAKPMPVSAPPPFKPTTGGEADALAKELDKEIRAAERNYQNGNMGLADEQLKAFDPRMGSLRASAPEHKKLSTLQRKYDKLRKDLDRRMAKSAPSSSAGNSTASKGMSGADRKRAMLKKRAQASAPNPAVVADAELAVKLYNEHYPSLEIMTGNSIVFWGTGNGFGESRAALPKFQAAENAIAAIAADVARMAELYDGSREMENQSALSSNIANAMRKQNNSNNVDGDAGGKLAKLIRAYPLLVESRTATGDYLADYTETMIGAWGHQVTDAQLEKLKNGKTLMTIAYQIDPNGEKVQKLLNSMDERIDQFIDKMTAAIDAAEWPGNSPSFPGPGNVEQLANDAIKYFSQHDAWGGVKKGNAEVVSVCVTGPWKVAERDTFGRPIRWRLPVSVAMTNDDYRDRNIARVYDLSALAMQGPAGNAPKAPPFDGYWVGDNFMMRLNKFK